VFKRNRNRWVATGAAAIACALVATAAPAAAAGTGVAPAARDAGALAQKVSAVALTADEVVTRSSGQQSTSRFFRDGQGRTRLDSGSTVTINDPATKSTLRLDVASKTYTRTTKADPAANAIGGPSRSADAATDKSVTSTSIELGTAMVNGVRAEGRRYTVTTTRPETGKVQRQVTVWLAAELELAVKTQVVEPDGSSYTQSYTNIRTGAALATELFAVPQGFQAAAARPMANATAGAGTNASCPLNLFPSDPLLLVSVGLFFSAGIVAAETDGSQSCFFVADLGVFEYPLWGYPITPLFLPSDQWFVYDTGGGCLPFYPYVAFGDVVFAATSSSDQTVKDNLVILTIFP
jgi:hypothetical protein